MANEEVGGTQNSRVKAEVWILGYATVGDDGNLKLMMEAFGSEAEAISTADSEYWIHRNHWSSTDDDDVSIQQGKQECAVIQKFTVDTNVFIALTGKAEAE